MTENSKTKKSDFVEVKFTGYANGDMFDSNVLENLKKIDKDAKDVAKTVIVIGENMVVPGLDAALNDKEYGKKYVAEFSAKEGFGERNKNLLRVIPLKAFTEQKVMPQAGMVLTLDNSLVKILAVSGARVTVDFNNPLAGKMIKYEFEIVKKVEDEKEKIETLFRLFFRMVPEYTVEEKTITVKGPKNFEMFITIYKQKFTDLIGKELTFAEMTKEEIDAMIKKHEEAQKNQADHDGHTHDGHVHENEDAHEETHTHEH